MWIFQHFPKVGGTSLTSALRLVFGTNKMYAFQGLYPNDHARFFRDHNLNVQLVTGHVNFGIHRYTEKTCRYVALMRHPVPRVISQWYNQYWWNTPSVHTHKGIKNFEEYVSYRTSVIGNNMVTRMVAGVPEDLNKVFVTMTCPCTEEMYQMAVKNIDEWYDYVGLQETMQHSFERMIHVMGRDKKVRVPVKNVTKNTVQTGRIVPPDNAKELILKNNQFDLRLYEYCREKFV